MKKKMRLTDIEDWEHRISVTSWGHCASHGGDKEMLGDLLVEDPDDIEGKKSTLCCGCPVENAIIDELVFVEGVSTHKTKGE